MNDTSDHSSIQQEVLAAIKSGRVKMRPKWYFFLRAALVIVGAAFLFLTVLYLTSFIIFMLRQTGVLFVPAFGLRGLWVFLVSLPWLLIGAALLFILILEVLVKQYAFAYRRPLLYSTFAILFLVTAGGLVIAMTPLHPGLFKQAKEDALPLAGPLYRQFLAQRFPDIHKGMVIEFVDTGFFMKNNEEETLQVVVTSTTHFPFDSELYTGEWVVVFGRREDGTIQALGVHKVSDLMEEVPRMKGKSRHFGQ